MAKTDFLPAPKSANEAFQLAEMLSKSSLLPATFKGKPADIVIGMMWSHNLGIPFLQGMQYIAVVNGRPSMYGDGALAVVMASGLLEDFSEQIVENPEDHKLIAVCTVKRRGITSQFVRKFSQRDAEMAMLWNKQGPWKQYPKRMLQMRARAYALRDAFPDVLSGMAIAEEQQDVSDSVASAAVSAATPEAAPAKRMPRRRTAAAQKPAPATVEAEDIEEVKPMTPEAVLADVKTEEPSPDVSPVEAEASAEVEQDAALFDDEVPPPEVPSSIEWKSRIEAASSYDELKSVWRGLPEATRADKAVLEAFTARHEALKAMAQGM